MRAGPDRGSYAGFVQIPSQNAAPLEKKAGAAAMGLSKAQLHYILRGTSRLTAAASVRLSAVIEDAHLAVAGGAFDIARVQRRAREYLMLQMDVDLVEAVASRPVRAILDGFADKGCRPARPQPAVPRAVYAAAAKRGAP